MQNYRRVLSVKIVLSSQHIKFCHRNKDLHDEMTAVTLNWEPQSTQPIGLVKDTHFWTRSFLVLELCSIWCNFCPQSRQKLPEQSLLNRVSTRDPSHMKRDLNSRFGTNRNSMARSFVERHPQQSKTVARKLLASCGFKIAINLRLYKRQNVLTAIAK